MHPIFASIGKFFSDAPTPMKVQLPMKMSDLRDAAVSDASKLSTLSQALSDATSAYNSQLTVSTASTTTFASAIVEKGGEVTDTGAVPPISYRSTDSVSYKTVVTVSMSDDAPEPAQPVVQPAPVVQPTTDPNATQPQ